MPEPALHRLEVLLARCLLDDAEDLGVPESVARVLLALGEGPGIAMGEMARRLGRDATTATRFVDRAERLGLVARTVGAGDRRQRMASATPAGAKAARRLEELAAARRLRLAERIEQATGLGEEQAGWFVAALVAALDVEGRASPAVAAT